MNKHTATYAGTTATRNSRSRTYSHAVFAQQPAEAKVAQLEETIRFNTAKAAEYRAQAAAGGQDMATRTGRVIGRHTAEDFIRYAEECEQGVANAQALLDAGVSDSAWGCIAWSGRLDLAEKEARRWAKRTGDRVQIVEAEMTATGKAAQPREERGDTLLQAPAPEVTPEPQETTEEPAPEPAAKAEPTLPHLVPVGATFEVAGKRYEMLRRHAGAGKGMVQLDVRDLATGHVASGCIPDTERLDVVALPAPEPEPAEEPQEEDRVTLEHCTCGECFDCPDGYHGNDAEDGPCCCTPDCIVGVLGDFDADGTFQFYGDDEDQEEPQAERDPQAWLDEPVALAWGRQALPTPQAQPERGTFLVPERFYDDHVSRDLPAGVEVRRTRSGVVVELSAGEYAELRSDAEHYAHPDGGGAMGPECQGLRSSARATLKALDRQAHHVPQEIVQPA